MEETAELPSQIGIHQNSLLMESFGRSCLEKERELIDRNVSSSKASFLVPQRVVITKVRIIIWWYVIFEIQDILIGQQILLNEDPLKFIQE